MFLMMHLSWIIALHVMAVIAWMAGIFYLPRLFVYHTQVQHGTTESDRFTLMERRLLKQIMAPAMVVTFLTGSAMASLPGVVDWHAGWWWAKLVSVIGMFAFHGTCARWWRGFSQGRNAHSERYYRVANEVPTILMMIIVVMIIVRP